MQAVAAQAARGSTAMLPTEDAAWVGEELARRFGLPFWQFALTATDANRFALRLAREVTGRGKVLVFDWCYHGSVDEALAATEHGVVGPRAGNVGPPVHPALTTKVVQFNDLDALEQALRAQDVACVLAEPALTNIGIVLPDDGFHDALRELTRKHRHAARDRRDAHAERGPRRLHTGLGARARHRHGRQGDRRRDARRGVRRLGRARRADHGERPRPTTRTRAGSAARWPATRSRSRPSARRSSTCSPRRRSRARSRSPSGSRRTCRRRSRTRPSRGT